MQQKIMYYSIAYIAPAGDGLKTPASALYICSHFKPVKTEEKLK